MRSAPKKTSLVSVLTTGQELAKDIKLPASAFNLPSPPEHPKNTGTREHQEPSRCSYTAGRYVTAAVLRHHAGHKVCTGLYLCYTRPRLWNYRVTHMYFPSCKSWARPREGQRQAKKVEITKNKTPSHWESINRGLFHREAASCPGLLFQGSLQLVGAPVSVTESGSMPVHFRSHKPGDSTHPRRALP